MQSIFVFKVKIAKWSKVFKIDQKIIKICQKSINLSGLKLVKFTLKTQFKSYIQLYTDNTDNI